MAWPIAYSQRSAARMDHFNLLRMLAAFGVLVSHAYPISLGPQADQPLKNLIGVNLGALSVAIFFAISGFFITMSFHQSSSVWRFAQARILRLFPALLVVLVVTVLVGGLFLTTAPLSVFGPAGAGYILQNVTLIKPVYSLPGVFENAPYGAAINGSLWTILYEALCYIAVFFLGCLGVFKLGAWRAVIYAAMACLAVVLIYVPVHPLLGPLGRLGLPFLIGSAFYLWQDHLPLNGWVGLALLPIVYFSMDTAVYYPILMVAISYWVFLLGYWPNQMIQRYNRLGDYSYGLYIYAFPAQQLVAYWGVREPLVNIGLSLCLALPAAILSWYWVEKPALRLKRKTR